MASVKDNIELRWHGRAQQGVVTAAKLLAEAALMEGKYVQAFPEFGPERMGAPVRAFDRISVEEIRVQCQVKNPNVVLIVDPTLIGMQLTGGMEGSGSVTDGTDKDAVFIVNTPKSASEMRTALKLDKGFAKVFTVDASKISEETIGRHMPNTPALGALAKATGIINIDSLINNFKENYGKKYSQKVIDGNVAAMKRGYDEVKGE
ncbi:MAG: 2-oxoacid:acceptor oxidoreductase family protein [Deltaproteobacteria bacterium]|nr:2-oxoacid:acceptor oxidoreductase family protein [Deltaproteobacteria bacterium]